MKQLLRSLSITCEGHKADGDFCTPKAQISSADPDRSGKFRSSVIKYLAVTFSQSNYHETIFFHY